MDSSSSSSSDEEILKILRAVPRPRYFRNRKNPFHEYDNDEFKARFRLSKPIVMDLLHEIGPNLEPTTRRNMSISACNQLLIALRFYASGTFQIVVGDSFNIHKSTVCRILRRVTHFIALQRPRYIHMPRNEEEAISTKLSFYNIRRFPGVLGCIDCTHIPIQSPGGDQAELYRNRKGYFSVNTQIVCSADLKICDIVARWPGSTHDSTIFNASYLRAQLEAGEIDNGHLLGDSAYACRNYLMTPLLNPTTDAEQRYNAAHIQTRNTVERCIGVLKRRFPCLSLGMRTNMKLTLAVIVATAVLHNIALNKGEDVPDDQIDIQGLDVPDAVQNHDIRGSAARTALINTSFN